MRNQRKRRKIIKRLISGISAIALSVGLLGSIPASADDLVFDAQLNTELSVVESVKELYDLEDVDFDRLTTSDRIPIYNSSNIKESGSCVPIFYNNVLRMIALDSNNGNYQIISIPRDRKIKAGTQIAFLIDNNGISLYNGKNSKYIFKNTQLSNSSDSTKTLKINNQSIKLSKTLKNKRIAYTTPGAKRIAQQNYICNVQKQLQNPYRYICWAACIAMIKNYADHNNKYTAEKVAKNYSKNSNNFDKVLSPDKVARLMRDDYGLNSYFYKKKIPTDSIMMSNLKYDNPMIGEFKYRNSDERGHAVCIYGINSMAGRLLIIDPLLGYTTAVPNGTTYSYKDKDGYTLKLCGAVCRSWGAWW